MHTTSDFSGLHPFPHHGSFPNAYTTTGNTNTMCVHTCRLCALSSSICLLASAHVHDVCSCSASGMWLLCRCVYIYTSLPVSGRPTLYTHAMHMDLRTLTQATEPRAAAHVNSQRQAELQACSHIHRQCLYTHVHVCGSCLGGCRGSL